MTIGMRWFPQRKGMAMGVVVGGFGGGAFIFNQIQVEPGTKLKATILCESSPRRVIHLNCSMQRFNRRIISVKDS